MKTVCSSDSITKNCCGNCARYVRNPKKPGYGLCDEWGGVELSDDVVCHPYIGKPKNDSAKAGCAKKMRDVIHEVQANEADEIVVHKLAEIAADCAWCERKYGEATNARA